MIPYRSIRVSTFGILYIRNPHQGSPAASLGDSLLNLTKVLGLTAHSNDKLLKSLKVDSDFIDEQQFEYMAIIEEFTNMCAWETRPTELPIPNQFVTVSIDYLPPCIADWAKVVPKPSAVIRDINCIDFAIDKDHIQMVKFASKEDPGYKSVSYHLGLLAKGAVEAIPSRWKAEEIHKGTLGTSRRS